MRGGERPQTSERRPPGKGRPLPPQGGADDLRETLRRAGLRATLPRLAVLRALTRAEGLASHSEIASRLEAAGLDRVTVYRNLLDLVRAGLARRTDVGDHVWRFEAPRPGQHPHFLCRVCGSVACLDGSVSLAPNARLPRSLRAEGVEILVKGRCDRCAT